MSQVGPNSFVSLLNSGLTLSKVSNFETTHTPQYRQRKKTQHHSVILNKILHSVQATPTCQSSKWCRKDRLNVYYSIASQLCAFHQPMRQKLWFSWNYKLTHTHIMFIHACGVDVSLSGLQVSPSNATRFVGDTVRLNCSDSSRNDLYWKHQGVGTTQRKFMSTAESCSLLTFYQRGGRHSVESNTDTGSCDLLITRLTAEDAGTYVCKREDGAELEINLIVIGE